MRIGLIAVVSGTLAVFACGDDLSADPAEGSTGGTAGTSSGSLPETEGLDTSGGSSSTGEPEVPWDGQWPTLECDPLVPDYCGLPYPNNAFTVADEATVTGLRIELSDAMMPVANNGVATTRDVFNTRDGFSPGIALLAHLPGATLEGLPRPDDIGRSLEPDCPTVLLDTQTGQRVPHWAELDMTTDDDSRRTFMIRPVVRLEDDRRYIVAIRGVVDSSGAALEATPVFAALRDRTESEDPSVEARRGLYADIFAQLEEAAVERDALQLAWDFSTASKEDGTGWLLGMRDEALASVGPEGPAYTIDSVTTDWSPDVAVRLLGHMEVPLYLDQPGVGGVINLGDDGRPEVNGTAEYPFEVLVPYSAMDEPAALLQFGHGLFGSYASVEGLGPLANRHNLVIFAFDWIGMSEQDALPTGGLLASGDLAAFQTLPSRLLQSHVNALLGMRMMMGGFVDEPTIQFAGGSAIDPDERYYFGASLGGIMGSVYMAITPDVVRGGLGVPGQSFNLLLSRSVLFDPFFSILGSSYEDPRDIQLILSVAMQIWDRAEPTGFSKYIREGLADTPPHEVLLQVAIGDHQVTNYGSHVMARTIGVPLLTPSTRSIWGVDEVVSGHVGSAMIEHDFGLPPIPLDNVPMREGSDPHGILWSYDAGIDELEHFLRTGEVLSFCEGPCDPE
ncbi:MAG: hypothetical protein AB1Z98_37360 [Nannocystaceae bacterium]